MIKNKYLVSIIVIIIILSMVVLPLVSAMVTADSGSMLFFDFLGEEEPEQKTVYTKDISITGRAKEGTKITINIYRNIPADEKSIVFNNKENEEDSDEWDLKESIERVAGASCTIAASARIVIGKYKVEAIAEKDEDVIVYEAEIEYKDRRKIIEQLRKKILGDFDITEE